VENELNVVSDEQKAVILAILAAGTHSFVGGAAGTGKSVLGKALVACLRSLHGMDDVLYVATTIMSAYVTGDPEASTAVVVARAWDAAGAASLAVAARDAAGGSALANHGGATVVAHGERSMQGVAPSSD